MKQDKYGGRLEEKYPHDWLEMWQRVRGSVADLVMDFKERGEAGEELQEAPCFSGWSSLWVPR